MSRTTSRGEPIAHAMTTGDKQRALDRAKRLNRRTRHLRWEARRPNDGPWEVVAERR
jgi:hypothetical protein